MKVQNQVAHNRDALKVAGWVESPSTCRMYVEWEAGHTFDVCVALNSMHHNNEGKRTAMESGLHERMLSVR